MTGAVTGWAKLFFKRYIFGIKLKRICNRKGYRLEKSGIWWWLGRNKSEKCNFLVDCGANRYSVKLVGVRSRKIYYGFINEHSYEIKDYTFALVHTMDSFEYAVKKKEPYKFDKDAAPCIVMIPDSVKVTVRNRNEQRDRQEIGSRESVPEGTFFFGENFLEFLEEKNF